MDLKSYFSKMNIELTDKQCEQLDTFYNMLVEKNKVMNLTAITEYDEVVVKHFADSAAIALKYDMSKVQTLIDVGTGAGFPGIVLKILLPQIKMVLLDSLNKRLAFLNEVIETLGLENITTIHGRAEDLGHDIKYREQFDLCVSRAVANLSVLTELCIPFVKVDGDFVSYKAGGCESEIAEAAKAIKTLSSELTEVATLTLPETDYNRVFAVIHKKTKLSKTYPRKAGTPAKNPIK